MTKIQNNIGYTKSGFRVFLDYFLLAVCLCVIAIRTTYTESPNAQLAVFPITLGDTIYSLILSAILIFSFLIWLIAAVWDKKFVYRFSSIELGLMIFIFAATVSGFFASDKRAAITDSLMLIAPMLMTVLLVQILDSNRKVTIVLVAIAALGIASTNQCAYQHFASNPVLVEQYQKSPESILGPLGIQKGSYDHMMLEHRILSQDVRGFFTTSNSAGAFFIFSIFSAVGLIITAFKNRKENKGSDIYLIASIILLVVIFFGLISTKSKGAIAAFILAAGMFVAYLLFGKWLARHKKAVCIIFVLSVFAIVGVIVSYGVKHQGLTGGNSMLVRWQYWTASFKMFTDNPLKGVGGGNFGTAYTQYKPAGALEVVSDPHNFLLSILTRFGLPGLVGFLTFILPVFWQTIFSKSENLSADNKKSKLSFQTLSAIFGTILSVILLIVRPMLLQEPTRGSFDAIFLLYIVPVFVFAMGFWLFSASQTSVLQQPGYRLKAAIFCAVLGCLIHSMVDYAIFEPGVFATFLALAAILLSINFNNSSKPATLKTVPVFLKVLVPVMCLGIMGGYIYFAFIPVARAGAKIAQATNDMPIAIDLLYKASKIDRLDPTPLKLNGNLHLQIYDQMLEKNPAVLTEAISYYETAKERDPIDYRNYEKISDIYFKLTQIAQSKVKAEYLNKAFEAGTEAIKYYPNSDKLNFNLAKIAELLGKTEIAIENYQLAVKIEDSYRKQFRQMYPGREMYSRLGEENYQYALKRLKELSSGTTQR